MRKRKTRVFTRVFIDLIRSGYRWEKDFERSWEQLTEDERGLRLQAVEKKKRYQIQKHFAQSVPEK
jgi:hypothetical protein